ncbi:hypothetical protein H7J86_26210 [Mycobacterium hackensackense]|uniref:hypothetical protein n=1 Tax=Mycobacterium hackensackense TaxID=228909 RepID=UPI0022658728|nr:hypothetical protein [Mycobacterium hackensackense]MCV7255663.1 hypothetical protein [Mycobacterium hackensackense]
MTTPNTPRSIEIRVDGRTVHTFLAESFRTEETHQKLTLDADRWQPKIDVPPNPAFTDPPEPPDALRAAPTGGETN